MPDLPTIVIILVFLVFFSVFSMIVRGIEAGKRAEKEYREGRKTPQGSFELPQEKPQNGSTDSKK